MKTNINSKNLTPSDKLVATIEKKLERLDKFFSNECTANVMISEEKSGLAKMEVSIKAGSLFFRSEESDSDLFFCLDRVVDKLSSQMSKQKGRLLKKYKDSKEVYIKEIPDAAEDEKQSVERVKEVELLSMSSDEAILQMELLSHNFFVYKDEDTGSVNVLYKRKNGGYGLMKTR